MTTTLDVPEAHLAIVRDILRRHLPPDIRVLVFGSRALGTARKYSDLDLALEWHHPLGLTLLGELAEAFSESDLPYRTDVLDMQTISPDFRERILTGAVPLPLHPGKD